MPTGARGKLVSATTPGIHAGVALSHTCPGRPTPLLKVISQLMARNRGKRAVETLQLWAHRRQSPLAIDHPERAMLSAERFADRLQNSRRGFLDGGRIEQDARRDVRGGQLLLSGAAD